MLPASWIPHRRSDGETIGWIEIDGDDPLTGLPGVDLEEVVFAIVEGRMSEWRSGPKRDVPWRFHVAFDAIRTHGGYEAGWSARGPEPFELPTKPHRWGPWPLRTD